MSKSSYLEFQDELSRLHKRIAELEAQVEALTSKPSMLEQVKTLRASVSNLSRDELIEMVEALTPKPVSTWANIFVEYPGDWHTTLAAADHYCKSGGDYIGRLRRDKITHPDGRVEYKLEVEK